MNRRKGRLLAWGSAVVGVVVLLACGFAFRDRLLEEYSLHALQSGNRKAQEAAAERLAETRTVRAVPVLLGLLVEIPGAAQQRFAFVALWGPGKQPTVERITTVSADMTPKVAARFVGHSLAVPETQLYAVMALKKLLISSPESCVSHLAEALGADSWYRRYVAAKFLACLGPRSKAAVPELIQALNAPRDRVAQADRAAAARALGRIGSEARDALPALHAVVDEIPSDQNRHARDFASEAIVWIQNPDESLKREIPSRPGS